MEPTGVTAGAGPMAYLAAFGPLGAFVLYGAIHLHDARQARHEWARTIRELADAIRGLSCQQPPAARAWRRTGSDDGGAP